MNKLITIILAEDHLIVREGIRKLLQDEADFTIVAEATTGREVLAQVAQFHPDVVVMDIAMPLLNGLEACRQLSTAASASRVLILSAYGDDAYVESALDAGAAGFSLKQAPGSELPHAIREVSAGRHFFSDAILRRYRSLQTRCVVCGSRKFLVCAVPVSRLPTSHFVSSTIRGFILLHRIRALLKPFQYARFIQKHTLAFMPLPARSC